MSIVLLIVLVVSLLFIVGISSFVIALFSALKDVQQNITSYDKSGVEK